MATTTTRLALRKPAGSDNVNVTTDLSDNFEKIDDSVLFVRKTANESVTSSTVLQADDHLFIALEANTIYTMLCFIGYVGNDTGDIKFAWGIPAGTTMDWFAIGGDSLDAGFAAGATRGETQFFASLNQTTNPTGSIDYTASTSSLAVLGIGMVRTTGTAGNLTLNWAQNTSNGTATTVAAGSWVQLTKVG